MAKHTVTGKTSKGFEYSVPKRMLTNAEFLEVFADVQNGDMMQVFKLIGIVLGKDQKKALYDFLRDEDGMVPVEAVSAELSEIIEALGKADETKN